MALSTPPDTENLDFLRARVASFGLFAGGFCLFFWLYRLVNCDELRQMLKFDSITHLASSGLLLAVWGALQLGRPTRLFIRAIESVGLVGSCALLVAMGMTLDRFFSRPEYTMLLGLAFINCSRAVYVPSSSTRTAILASIIGAILLGGVYFSYVGIDMAPYAKADPALTDVTAAMIALRATVGTAIWWTLFAGLAFATSRVIYGLRKEAQASRQLGQYKLDRKIGAGGMGIVYEAHHAMLRRPTAIKLLPPEKAGEAAIMRFEREVKLTARLRHPNTITIYDYGRTPDGIFYYAMELLNGATLDQIVQAGGPLPAARVGRVLRQAAGALAEAHDLGLIHRDIKPSNIMLCNQGGQADIAKVLDFGLVKDIGPAKGNHETDAILTQTDALTGTPLYMAPEAITTPDKVDARSDLYALGAVGYFMLTGEHVFTGDSVIEICSQHLHEAPPPPSSRTSIELPAELEALLMQCLEKKPEARPASAEQFLLALEKCNLPKWDRMAADSWWQKHEPQAAKAKQGTGTTSQTVMIDLARRT